MRALVAVLFLCCVAAQGRGAEPAVPDKPVLVIETGGHHANITNVFVTPDSQRLVTVSLDRTVRVWRLADGEAQKTLRLPVGPGVRTASFWPRPSPATGNDSR